MEENWGSMVSEYAEQVVDENKVGRRHSPKRGSRHLARQNAAYSDHTQQLFNRGVVFPMQRAPPGLTAQEVESESGNTEASSWVAASRPVRYYTQPSHNVPLHSAREREGARYFERSHYDMRKQRYSSQSSQQTSGDPHNFGSLPLRRAAHLSDVETRQRVGDSRNWRLHSG